MGEFGSGQGRLWEGMGGRPLRETDGRAARSAYSTHRGASRAKPCDAPHCGKRAGTRGAEGKRNGRDAVQGGGGACPVQRRAKRWRRPPKVLLVLGILAVWPLHGVDGNEMYVAGYNDYGQLGMGDYLERSTQTYIGNKLDLDLILGIAAGLYHNLVLGNQAADRGIVYAWGRNTKGQLGTGSVKSVRSPRQVSWAECKSPSSWTCSPSVCESFCDQSKCKAYGPTNPYWSADDMHCMKPQDRIWDTAQSSHPMVLQVETGSDSSYALTENGDVFSWGSNDWGQLGITNFDEEQLARWDGKYLRDTPQLVRNLLSMRILRLDAGTFHVLALNDIGEVWGWGQNAEGQLGMGDLSQRNQPAKLAFLQNVNIVEMACGAYHSIFLTDVGEVYTTGLNSNGQLGHDDEVSRKAPTMIASLSGFIISAIASGDYAAYAVTDKGEVFSWGNNGFGQLGHGNSSTVNPQR